MLGSHTIALTVALGLSLPLRPKAAEHVAALPEPAASPAPQTSSESEVASLLQRADTAFEQGRLLDAWDAIDEAEALEPGPLYEYMRGLIRQAQGRCDLAVEHWARYLDSGPAQSDAADVRGLIDECGGLPARRPEPDLEPPAPPAPLSIAAPTREPREATQVPPPPWYRDVPGGVLLGVGATSLVTGSVLWAVAGQQQRQGPRGSSLMIHDTRIRRARGLSYGAIAAGSIGVALVVGAIVRYVQVRRRTPDLGHARRAPTRGPTARF